MATKQAQAEQVETKAENVETQAEELPLVHHMVRTLSAGPIPGAMPFQAVDADVSAWLHRGYTLAHVDSHIEQHQAGAENHYVFVTLYVLTRNGAG